MSDETDEIKVARALGYFGMVRLSNGSPVEVPMTVVAVTALLRDLRARCGQAANHSAGCGAQWPGHACFAVPLVASPAVEVSAENKDGLARQLNLVGRLNCPKCSGGVSKRTYVPKDQDWRRREEHMHIRCLACGYAHEEPCDDALTDGGTP